MALNLKDEEAVRLAGEVAARTGESKTRAIRVALQERLERLETERPETPEERVARMTEWLEREVWSKIPTEERGRPPMTKEEREELLGYDKGLGFTDH